ncbi:MAG: sialate O-acetylesterase [Clostridia bacterium]|nr:sialate O-acetylesterase [Clostridia bacterium]
MAGRGLHGEVPPIVNKNVVVLRNGRWQGMYVPVNCDRPFSGHSLAESFADQYAKEHPGVTVGLIPCADGGTSLDQWKEGSLLYDHAVLQTRLALRTSNVAGVLWHQGEADCAPSKYPLYEEKFSKIKAALRRDLGLEDVPFLLGGLGDFLPKRSENLKNYLFVNDALKRIADADPYCGFVSAEGIGCNSDNLHFSTAGLYEFGVRYYEEYCRLENKDRVFVEKPREDGAVRSEMELL